MTQRGRQIERRSPQQQIAASTSMGWRSRAVAGALLIAGLALLAYSPALQGGFIWDDEQLLVNNNLVKAPDGLYRMWLTKEPIDFWPMTYSTFWVEWRLWKMNPAGYHLTNLVLHIASALLIWAILHRLNVPGAFLAALLFAVQPINVESVAWISQRKNTLAIFFYLLSILLFLRAEDSRGARHERRELKSGFGLWYWMSLISFILAMLSKGSVAILPIVLLLVTWWQRGRISISSAVRSAPFFLLAGVLSMVNIWFQRHGEQIVVRDVDFSQRVAGAGAVVWFYLSKALVPFELVFVYPQWNVQSNNLHWWLPCIGAVVVTVALWRKRNHQWGRALLFAWAYFCIALVPVMGFTDVGFMKYSLVADHYQHIALIGVAALAGAGLECWRRHAGESKAALAVGATALVACGLTFLTFQESKLYATPIRLYEATLAKNPDCWVIHNNLGRALGDVDRSDDEIAHYLRALEINPELAVVHNNLAISFLKKGHPQEAIDQCLLALAHNPPLAATFIILGDTYLQSDRLSEAMEQYQQALRVDPKSCDAHIHLGSLFRKSGQLDAAIQQYQAALQLNPNSPDAYNNLGNALKQAGQLSDAAEQYQHALQLKPDLAEAHINLGSVMAQAGRFSAAIEHYQQALRLKPNSSEARFNLGNALVKTGRPQEAIEHFQIVLRLKPDDLEAAVNLMNAFADAGLTAEAIAAAVKALELARSQGNAALVQQIEAWLARVRPSPESAAR